MRAVDKIVPRERNEISNMELRNRLKNMALGLLVQGDDYSDLADRTRCEFGYLYDIRDHGIEALFKLVTGETTAYFLVQGGEPSWVNYDETLFKSTTESFLYMHKKEYEGRKVSKCEKWEYPKGHKAYLTDQPFISNYSEPEGEGRRYGAGGEACDYCPHCDGSKDWCPWMD